MAEAITTPDAHPPASPAAGEDLRVVAADPWVLCLLFALAFGALAAIRLTIPSEPYFDEVHYLPAARELLAIWGDGGRYINREHPLLAKELLALGMAIFGDNPLGWRIMPLLAGMAALFAAMRALWHASHDRYATLAYGLLLATGFHLFVFARIAMLDMFMAAFLAVAAWQFAAAIRQPEQGRRRLALTGIAIGCALASKWSAVPLAVLPGLVFFAARLAAHRRRLLFSRRGIPVPGISLAEAFVWLGILPLAVYALTFVPGYWFGDAFHPSPLGEKGLIGFHGEMLELQTQVLPPHNYQSNWPQWVLNTRAVWYLYLPVDGAQRGIVLIGNPLTMLAGIFALAWCAITGLAGRDWAKIGAVAAYAASLGMWLALPKPVQFYYHYFVPHFFLLAALALASADLARTRWKWVSTLTLAGSAAMFAIFYKILSAAPLEGPMSFAKWMWLAGWR